MLIGFIEVIVAGTIQGGTTYAGPAAFLVMVFFMLFKPEGILGEKTLEKV
jgi:branched-chain amino acid transport system permease protein